MATKTKSKNKKARPQALPPAKVVGKSSETIHLEHVISNVGQSRGMGVLSRLLALGYGLFEKASTDKDPIWEMLFSPKPEKQKEACRLIEELEPSIVTLADSARKSTQIQDVVVHTVPDGNDGDEGFDVIAGMRRCIALAYNHAKHGTEPTVDAKVWEFDSPPTSAQLRLLALEENDDRQEESPIDRALTYQRLYNEDGMDFKDIAAAIGKSEQYVREYVKILLSKELEDKRLKVHSGEMTVDAAIKLYHKRKKEGADAKETHRDNGDSERYRLWGAKQYLKAIETNRKPKQWSDDEWELFNSDDVRRYMCLKLGLEYKPYEEPAPEPEPEPEVAKLKVKKGRAQKLLIALGKTNARTFSDETLKEKLENIPNQMESEEQELDDSGLQKLLDKLLEGYKNGDLSVEIVTDK